MLKQMLLGLFLAAAVSAHACRVERLADGGWRFFRAGETTPFAVCAAPADGIRLTVRTEPGSPFVFFDAAPDVQTSDRTVRRIDLPRIALAPFVAKPKAMSNAGLTEVDGHTGALGLLGLRRKQTVHQPRTADLLEKSAAWSALR